MPVQEPRISSLSSDQHPYTLDHEDTHFRRIGDWERLTRLEYIVEAVAKETERQASELTLVIQTQRDMLSHLKTIKFTIIGGLCGLVISQIGIEKASAVLLAILGV